MQLLQKLESIHDRYRTLEERLSDPEVVSNIAEYTKTSKEYKDLEEIIRLYMEYKRFLQQQTDAKEILDSGDQDMAEYAKEELQSAETALEDLEARLKIKLVPKDPEDSKDVIFEIRSGTGGSEASLFAGDLFRMYTRF